MENFDKLTLFAFLVLSLIINAVLTIQNRDAQQTTKSMHETQDAIFKTTYINSGGEKSIEITLPWIDCLKLQQAWYHEIENHVVSCTSAAK